jgi:hypothetical protein
VIKVWIMFFWCREDISIRWAELGKGVGLQPTVAAHEEAKEVQFTHLPRIN